jgi:hypothetical protein
MVIYRAARQRRRTSRRPARCVVIGVTVSTERETCRAALGHLYVAFAEPSCSLSDSYWHKERAHGPSCSYMQAPLTYAAGRGTTVPPASSELCLGRRSPWRQ